MNLAKEPYTKTIFRNGVYFCTPTMKYEKQKSGGEIPFAPATTKNKLSKNKSNQGYKRRVLRKLHNTEERN